MGEQQENNTEVISLTDILYQGEIQRFEAVTLRNKIDELRLKYAEFAKLPPHEQRERYFNYRSTRTEDYEFGVRENPLNDPAQTPFRCFPNLTFYFEHTDGRTINIQLFRTTSDRNEQYTNVECSYSGYEVKTEIALLARDHEFYPDLLSLIGEIESFLDTSSLIPTDFEIIWEEEDFNNFLADFTPVPEELRPYFRRNQRIPTPFFWETNSAYDHETGEYERVDYSSDTLNPILDALPLVPSDFLCIDGNMPRVIYFRRRLKFDTTNEPITPYIGVLADGILILRDLNGHEIPLVHRSGVDFLVEQSKVSWDPYTTNYFDHIMSNLSRMMQLTWRPERYIYEQLKRREEMNVLIRPDEKCDKTLGYKVGFLSKQTDYIKGLFKEATLDKFWYQIYKTEDHRMARFFMYGHRLVCINIIDENNNIYTLLPEHSGLKNNLRDIRGRIRLKKQRKSQANEPKPQTFLIEIPMNTCTDPLYYKHRSMNPPSTELIDIFDQFGPLALILKGENLAYTLDKTNYSNLDEYLTDVIDSIINFEQYGLEDTRRKLDDEFNND